MKQRHGKDVNEFTGLFFAFSNEQFKEGLAKIGVSEAQAKEKIYSIGAGGYILKSQSKAFNDMFKRHAGERKELKKQEKSMIDALAYELRNHEYCITYSTVDALDALGWDKQDIPEKVLKAACLLALK